jgi:hypothetical protein
VKGKDKLVPVHAIKACEGSGGRTPLILNLGIRAYRTVYLQEITPVPLE